MGTGRPERICAVRISKIVVFIRGAVLGGAADDSIVIDKHFDHVRQLISLRESTGKSSWLDANIVHRRLRAAVTAPLRELDQSHAFRDACQSRNRRRAPSMTGDPTPAVLHADARFRAQEGYQRIIHDPIVYREVAHLEKEIDHFAGSPIEAADAVPALSAPNLRWSANDDIDRLGVACGRLASGDVEVTDVIGACDLP